MFLLRRTRRKPRLSGWRNERRALMFTELKFIPEFWKPIPVVGQMRVLLQGAVGQQLRRLKEYGLCWP